MAEQNDLVKRRLEELEEIMKLGFNPYPHRFDVTATSKEVLDNYSDPKDEKETEERKAQAARANLLVLAGHLWLEERRRQEGLINHSTVWCARASICPKLQAPGAGFARPGRRSLRG